MYDDDDDDGEPLKLIRIHERKNWWKIYFFTAIFTSHQNIRIV